MRQAAKHGRGTFTHIGSLIDVADRMQALFEKIDSPVASDFSLAWPVQSESYPQKIPALYQGEPLLLAAKVSALQGELVVNGVTYNQVMPGLAMLTDLEIAEIATFVANSWENDMGYIGVTTVTSQLGDCK